MQNKIFGHSRTFLFFVIGLTAAIGLGAVSNLPAANDGPASKTEDNKKSKSPAQKAALGSVKVSTGTTTSLDAERQAAQNNPYANDMTWLTNEEREKFLKDYEEQYVAKYPKAHQDAFKVLKAKCAKCHEAVRPINSQFVEPEGKDVTLRKNAIESWRKTSPDIFKDKNVWQPEAEIWQRYVKRMMAKPGCDISKDEGKAIWSFLVHDSNQRKVGAKEKDWAKHRRSLLAEFEMKNPARYKELYNAAEGSKQEAKQAGSKK